MFNKDCHFIAMCVFSAVYCSEQTSFRETISIAIFIINIIVSYIFIFFSRSVSTTLFDIFGIETANAVRCVL